MKEQQSWQQFMQTGDIQDYLHYKETEAKAEDIQEDDEMNMTNQEN